MASAFQYTVAPHLDCSPEQQGSDPQNYQAWYNPHRCHTSIGSISPIDYEIINQADQAHTAA